MQIQEYEPYIRSENGDKLYYSQIADRIRRDAPETLGEHIAVQLRAVRLDSVMHRGSTPFPLPYTFADRPYCLFRFPSLAELVAESQATGPLFLEGDYLHFDPESKFWEIWTIRPEW